MTIWRYTRDESLADLRHAVRSWAEQRHLHDPDDVVLIVSELVTNAVVHGRATTVSVQIELQGVAATVTVDDPSATAPSPAHAGPHSDHGRGLLVVEALCSRWGYTAIPGGKRVWCEIRQP